MCSMHTVLWTDAKWVKCEMHQLVSAADVKKQYRKACLAVHPDKVCVFCVRNERFLEVKIRTKNLKEASLSQVVYMIETPAEILGYVYLVVNTLIKWCAPIIFSVARFDFYNQIAA